VDTGRKNLHKGEKKSTRRSGAKSNGKGGQGEVKGTDGCVGIINEERKEPNEEAAGDIEAANTKRKRPEERMKGR